MEITQSNNYTSQNLGAKSAKANINFGMQLVPGKYLKEYSDEFLKAQESKKMFNSSGQWEELKARFLSFGPYNRKAVLDIEQNPTNGVFGYVLKAFGQDKEEVKHYPIESFMLSPTSRVKISKIEQLFEADMPIHKIMYDGERIGRKMENGEI